jgi:sugar phosphate isomerase/epimerase
MTPWTIGLSTGCFYRRSIFEVLEDIRRSGFENVEVCSSPTHLDYHHHGDVARAGHQMRELGINPVSFHAPFAARIDITALDPHLRAAAVRELIAACEAAAAMHVQTIVLHPGPEREGRPPEAEFLDRMRHAAESLNFVAERCCQLQLNLMLENMLPHLLFGHINDMLYLLGSISTCKVGVCLDTGHAFLARELGTVIHKLSGRLQLVHVNDNRGDRDDHLAPGYGNINWPWVLQELRHTGFAGTLVLELASRDDEPVASMLARASEARRYIEDLIRRID